MLWPPKIDEYARDDELSIVPDPLFNLLAWIIGDVESPETSPTITPGSVRVNVKNIDTKRQILSIAQDVLYCSRGGHVKTPKHVLLSVAVHHLTRSARVVTLLNQFGHNVSYNQVLEIHTALADEALKTAEDGISISSHIDRHRPVVFAADNNDFLEETPPGANTTHCTNSIVVQRIAVTVPPPPDATENQQRSTWHGRWLQPAGNRAFPEYNADSRLGPGVYPLDITTLESPSDCSGAVAARHCNLVWLLTRLPSSPIPLAADGQLDTAVTREQVPDWSGFNAALSLSKVPPVSRIGYLPVINQSPTELATVHQVLKNAVNVAKQQGQDDIVVVVDQSIYAKAQELLWMAAVEEPDKFGNVVVRMGGFHVRGVMLAIIGKRFGDAGLCDLLVESELVAQGSVDGVISGKHFNRAMRAHKALAEALETMRCQEFEVWMESQEGS